MRNFLLYFQRYQAYGPLLIRLVLGYHVIRMSHSTALHPFEGIPQYGDYLKTLGFPWPVLSAALSAYAEFIGGILVILGLWTRWAALILLVNFILAVIVGHWLIRDSYANTFPALALLAISWFLLVNGPGKPSLDEGF